MKKLSKTDFYQASHDWAYSIYASQTVWLRRSFILIGVLIILLIIALLTNLALLPLKEKVPYLYAFDHATGDITKIGELEPTQLASDWTVTRYLLTHYVINRESYDSDNLDHAYQLVFAQTDDEIKQQYVDSVQSSNPHSPYKLYGKDKFITIHVISINKLNDNTADIKFTKILNDRSADTTQVIPREAIIKWHYSKAQTSEKILERDPLSFKVNYYQTTQVNVDNSQ